MVVLLVALASVPIVTSALHLAPRWVTQGDEATIALRSDDVLTADTPLLGMPSSLGESTGEQVHHPGPLEFQAIGVVAALVDEPRVALAVAACVNVVSIGVALVWASRLGGRPMLALATVVAAALTWSLRGAVLSTPFNPYVAVLPLLAFLASVAAAWAGRRWAVTSAIVFGSWAAQAHLTATGPVIAAAAAAAAYGLASVWRRGGVSWTSARWRGAAGGAALLGCWLLPLVDVAANEGGNPWALLTAGGSSEQRALGFGAALDVVVNALALRPCWAQAGAGPFELLAPPSTFDRIVAGALLLLVVTLAVRLRRDRPALAGAAIGAGAALAAGGLLTAKIPTAIYNTYALHNYLWIWPVSAVLWLVAVGGIGHLLASRTRGRRLTPTMVVAAATGVSLLLAVGSLGAPHRRADLTSASYVKALGPRLVGALDPDGRYLLELDRELDVFAVQTGLLYAMEHAGVDVRVPSRFVAAFGEHRVDDGETRQVLRVQLGRSAPEPPPRSSVVARYEPAPDLVEDRLRMEAALTEAVRARGGVEILGSPAITPDGASDWVESGGLLAALRFGFLPEDLADLPETTALADLALEPVLHVAVLLGPR